MRGRRGQSEAIPGKEAAITHIGWERVMIGILGLGWCSGFICVQTRFLGDLVFVLLYMVAEWPCLVLMWHCLCSPRE